MNDESYQLNFCSDHSCESKKYNINIFLEYFIIFRLYYYSFIKKKVGILRRITLEAYTISQKQIHNLLICQALNGK